ncbi:MAG: molybdopterin molybdenumtransferase MoeA, partial [Proteobacteria bacterium]
SILHEKAEGHQQRKTELVRLEESSGRVCAKRIFSTESLPAFDTSAMDGFAVHSAATREASPTQPLRLKVLGSLAAGDDFQSTTHQSPSANDENAAWEIMTGAGFPPGTDACVKQEDVEYIRNSEGRLEAIALREPVVAGQNRRLSGEDFSNGSEVIGVHHVLRDEDILVLASLGVMTIEVYSKLKVGVIATGKELVDLSEKPVGAQIRNSSMPYLLSALRSRGVNATSLGRVGDDPEDFMQIVRSAKAEAYDLILTTGAISVGKYDFVAKSLLAEGMETYFQKVAIRPGKPLLFGKLPEGPFVMGLPGNPVATATGFKFFVDPFLKALMHLPTEKPFKARLLNSTRKAAGATCFLKATLKFGVDGDLVVEANG